MPPTRRSTRPAAAAPARPYARADTRSSDSDSPAPVAKSRTARSTRNPRAVIEPDSDDEDMEEYDQAVQAQVNDDDEEQEEDEDEEEDMDDDDDDAEGEDDESVDGMVVDPVPPRIQQTASTKGRTTVTIKPPAVGKVKSVEAKEMGVDDDDLSDLDSEDNDMNDDNGDEGDEEDDEEDDDDDSDGSGSGTPDPSKLTRRQRGPVDEPGADLLALSNEAQARKHISAEEHAMRRAEMARRRKNLSEKRNEEEKIDTINKLLKKPAPKRRTRAEILAAQAAGEGGTPGMDGEDGDEPKADPVYARWVNNRAGSTISVPGEWLSAPVGSIFARSQDQTAPTTGARIMIEEVA